MRQQHRGALVVATVVGGLVVGTPTATTAAPRSPGHASLTRAPLTRARITLRGRLADPA